MSIAAHIKSSLELPNMVVRSYLKDLTDGDLFVRPLNNMNQLPVNHFQLAENRFHL